MGLVSKLKNILFEEEEVEIPVLEKKEKKVEPDYKEAPKKEEVRSNSNYNNFYSDIEEQPKARTHIHVNDGYSSDNYESSRPSIEKKNVYEEPKTPKVTQAPVERPRATYTEDRTFNFPAFDEEEFQSAMPRRSTNVLEHERKKETKKQEYKQPPKKEEPKEVKQKFRPSPIISPVYGILDKNYTPDEITTREYSGPTKVLDVDSVRRKAFGTLDDLADNKSSMPTLLNEEVEDVILEEKLEKARTIDELLRDSSDDIIDINDLDLKDDTEEVEPVPKKKEIEEDIEPKHVNTTEDTLESDLFDLIDSMYENREES